MKYDYIVWDWNGTLLDDAYIALKSVNMILAKRNMQPITIEQYYSYVDIPIIRFYEHIFDLNEVPFEILSKEFNENYDILEDEIKLHDGVLTKLKDFKSKGCRQIIVSAANQGKIDYFLDKFGILDYFDAVLGANDFRAESKIYRAKHYFKENSINPQKSIMIGDCVHDYDTAEAIGSDCILVCCGHQSKKDLKSTKMSVFESIDDILF